MPTILFTDVEFYSTIYARAILRDYFKIKSPQPLPFDESNQVTKHCPSMEATKFKAGSAAADAATESPATRKRQRAGENTITDCAPEVSILSAETQSEKANNPPAKPPGKSASAPAAPKQTERQNVMRANQMLIDAQSKIPRQHLRQLTRFCVSLIAPRYVLGFFSSGKNELHSNVPISNYAP